MRIVPPPSTVPTITAVETATKRVHVETATKRVHLVVNVPLSMRSNLALSPRADTTAGCVAVVSDQFRRCDATSSRGRTRVARQRKTRRNAAPADRRKRTWLRENPGKPTPS